LKARNVRETETEIKAGINTEIEIEVKFERTV
jgi:hypothetical protein